ncbi:MAG: helix-turn-helix transcriptional regulator, partial [Chloroflexota bacterium]
VTGQPTHQIKPELFGREAESKRIHRALDEARDGSGSLVLISGEAGVGKSALVEAILRAAREAGTRVLAGHCFDLSPGRPLSLWRDLLDGYRRAEHDGPHAPDILDGNAAVDGGEDREELFSVIRRFISTLTGEHPWVIVLEDLHWADSYSVDLLREISRSAGEHRLLMIATSRETAPSDTPFTQVIPALVREAPTHRIELRALRPGDIAEWVDYRYGPAAGDTERLVHFLVERTDGNPLLIQEMLNTLELDGTIERDGERWRIGDLQHARIPRLVQQMVGNRLLRMSEWSRRLLEFASVIGEHVPLDQWESASGASDEELDQAIQEAVEVNLLAESTENEGFRFSHALIRDAIYETVTLPRRRLWHEYVADYLASQPLPDPDAIADHLQLAGRGDAAVDWLVRAARRALSLHASDVAIKRVSTAMELSQERGVELPLDAYVIRARGLEIQGAFDAARADFERGFEIATAAGDHRLAWQAALDLGTAWVERDYQVAREWFDRALELADQLDDRAARASSLNWIGNWHINREQPQRARELHTEALEAFEDLGDRHGIAETLDLLAMATCMSADLAASATACNRAIPLFEELGDRRGLMMSLSSLTMTGGTMETITTVPAPYPREDFTMAGERALRIAQEIGWPAGRAVASIHLGLRLAASGDYARAWELVQSGHEIATSIGHQQWRISGSMVTGAMLIDWLAPERAVSWLEPALALARDVQSLYWERITLGLLAAAAIDSGDHEEARRILQPIEEFAGEMNTLASRFAAFQLARLDLAEGRPERTVERLDPLIASNHGESSAATPYLALLHAGALAALGRPEPAARELDDALHVATRRDDLATVWRIASDRASVASELADPDRAEALRSRATSTVEDLASHIHDDEVREQFLDRSHERISGERDDFSNPYGLSPREIEVLRLIADGLRDREIADELFISPRTVTNHVTSILQKMDVPSRAAATAQAVRGHII